MLSKTVKIYIFIFGLLAVAASVLIYERVKAPAIVPAELLLAERPDLIYADFPRINSEVKSPVNISGKARGQWYFEASFPVILKDGKGNILAQKPAEAQGEWMTMDFVPFRLVLEFTKPATATGTLILKKDNPSDRRDLDDELDIPVRFAE